MRKEHAEVFGKEGGVDEVYCIQQLMIQGTSTAQDSGSEEKRSRKLNMACLGDECSSCCSPNYCIINVHMRLLFLYVEADYPIVPS
jgi:hypothetical protein